MKAQQAADEVKSQPSPAATALLGEAAGRSRRGGPEGPDTIQSVRTTLNTLLQTIQQSDTAPTAADMAAASDRRKALAGLLQKWAALKSGH